MDSSFISSRECLVVRLQELQLPLIRKSLCDQLINQINEVGEAWALKHYEDDLKVYNPLLASKITKLTRRVKCEHRLAVISPPLGCMELVRRQIEKDSGMLSRLPLVNEQTFGRFIAIANESTGNDQEDDDVFTHLKDHLLESNPNLAQFLSSQFSSIPEPYVVTTVFASLFSLELIRIQLAYELSALN